MTHPSDLSSQLAVDVLDAHSLPAAFGVLGVAEVLRCRKATEEAGG